MRSLFWILLVVTARAEYLDDVREYVVLTQEVAALTDNLNTTRFRQHELEKLIKSIRAVISNAAAKQIEAHLNKKYSAEAQYGVMGSAYQNRLYDPYRNALKELESKTALVNDTRNKISVLNQKRLALESSIIRSQHYLVSDYAEIKDSVIQLVKRSTNLDTLMREIDTELSVGDLSQFEQMPPCDVSQFIKPTAGKTKVSNSRYTVYGIPGGTLFATNSGAVIFAGDHKKYGSMIIIVHSMDYKSVVCGDISPSVPPGKFVKSGAIIGKVAKNKRPTVHVSTYYMNEPFLSTEIVDNFVENVPG